MKENSCCNINVRTWWWEMKKEDVHAVESVLRPDLTANRREEGNGGWARTLSWTGHHLLHHSPSSSIFPTVTRRKWKRKSFVTVGKIWLVAISDPIFLLVFILLRKIGDRLRQPGWRWTVKTRQTARRKEFRNLSTAWLSWKCLVLTVILHLHPSLRLDGCWPRRDQVIANKLSRRRDGRW